MPNWKRLVLLVVLLAPAVCGCASGDNTFSDLTFSEFSAPDGNFAVLMPGQPNRKTQSVQGLELVNYTIEITQGGFTVGWGDAKSGTPLNLDGAVNGMAGAQQGTVRSSASFTLQGHAGKECEIHCPKQGVIICGRVLVADNRLYMVLAVSRSARLSCPAVRRYLDSFRLTPPQPPPLPTPPPPTLPVVQQPPTPPAFVPPVPVPPARTPVGGLVAHWSFDQIVNGAALDSSGRNNQARGFASSYGRGVKGVALVFDGSKGKSVDYGKSQDFDFLDVSGGAYPRRADRRDEPGGSLPPFLSHALTPILTIRATRPLFP